VRRLPLIALPLVCLLPAAAGAAPAGQLAAAAGPPASHVRVLAAMPPGESGFFSVSGQAAYEANGDPADFGPHVDDQRAAYWSERFHNGGFSRRGTPDQPHPGVAIYRDARGVPAVYGANAADVWWGAGYAVAQDRLFEMDAIRRLGRGTLAALAGSGAVPGDVEERVLTYTDKEYAAQFAALPRAAKVAITNYVAGANAWRAHAVANPSDLPAEYAVLSTTPAPFTVTDVLASGVYITRSVAAQGGDELDNGSLLRALEKKYGVRGGLNAFRDLFWQEDRKGMTTVPRSAGVFNNDDTPRAKRGAVFRRMAHYALGVPSALATGPGTGGYTMPGTTQTAAPELGAGIGASLARAMSHLPGWGASLHGGSFAYAISPKRSRDGHALLESAPQLGYTYPSELYELEIHGGGYDVRGATVPMLPVVGIGHNKHVAWAFTTGYSKTIDSFIETTRHNPHGGPPQYRHDGAWHNEKCRTETVKYRAAPQGVPTGPPSQSVHVRVCRTVHGPVVATAGKHARSVQYAMWGHEIATIRGVLGFDRARGLHDFATAAAKVTWNENVMMADDRGDIAYWHPGRYPRRSPRVDQRFAAPGTGRYDWRGMRAFSRMPHVINPKQGWLANWNNKPAVGWVSGDLVIPGGYADHVRVVADQLAHRKHVSFADLRTIDRNVGNSDARARDLLGPLLGLRHHPSKLTSLQRHVLTRLAKWDRRAAGPGTDGGPGTKHPATDAPAMTIFETYVHVLRQVLFRSLPPVVFTRSSEIGLHLYEPTAMDNLALRILRPSTSALPVHHDWLHGRTRADVLRDALHRSIADLVSGFRTRHIAAWRRAHPVSTIDSLTGVIGPSLTMPYEDRGTYEHLVDLGTR
jgi:penicillin amidase